MIGTGTDFSPFYTINAAMSISNPKKLIYDEKIENMDS
jgi:hypothetical protein